MHWTGPRSAQCNSHALEHRVAFPPPFSSLFLPFPPPMWKRRWSYATPDFRSLGSNERARGTSTKYRVSRGEHKPIYSDTLFDSLESTRVLMNILFEALSAIFFIFSILNNLSTYNLIFFFHQSENSTILS